MEYRYLSLIKWHYVERLNTATQGTEKVLLKMSKVCFIFFIL